MSSQYPAIERWLTLAEVASRFKVRRQTIAVWVRAGRFPRPIRLPGGRQVRWDSRAVEAFERELLRARAA